MSYEIVKKISFDKERREVIVNHESNNVHPKSFHDSKLPFTEATLRNIFRWLCGRCWQFDEGSAWFRNSFWHKLVNDETGCITSAGYYLSYDGSPDQPMPKFYDEQYYGPWNPQQLEANYQVFRVHIMNELGIDSFKWGCHEPGIMQNYPFGPYYKKFSTDSYLINGIEFTGSELWDMVHHGFNYILKGYGIYKIFQGENGVYGCTLITRTEEPLSGQGRFWAVNAAHVNQIILQKQLLKEII